MYTVYISTPSAVHGPTDAHSVATGRTLSIALARARARLDTYGPMNPGRIFYRRPNDGVMYPLIGA